MVTPEMYEMSGMSKKLAFKEEILNEIVNKDYSLPYFSLETQMNPEKAAHLIGTYYGTSQWNKLLEEVEELKEAISSVCEKLVADCSSKDYNRSRYHAAEEMADVLIVILSILSEKSNRDLRDLVESFMVFKSSRQLYRILHDDPKVGDPNESC